MAVSLLSREVSDLCIGKPALRSLAVSATVADALSALKRNGESYVSVWSCDHSWRKTTTTTTTTTKVDSEEDSCKCIAKICMVDIICFLSKQENLLNPGIALQSPVSVLVPKVSGIVKHLEPHARLSDAIDLILEGVQNLVIPLVTRRRFQKPTLNSNSTLHNNLREYCWLTQEDIIRYLFNSIGLIAPVSNHTIKSLGLIDSINMLTIHHNEPATTALPMIAQSLVTQTSVAIVDDYTRLVGDISPFILNSCDETVATAIAMLSTGDLMAYIDCGGPPEDLVQLIKERLEEKNMGAALELMDEDSGVSSSNSCSSDEESSTNGSVKSGGRFGGYSASVVRWSEAMVCYPWSSLVAVMIQALSRRVSYVWVVEEDGTLVGIVTSTGMLRVFQERLKRMAIEQADNHKHKRISALK